MAPATSPATPAIKTSFCVAAAAATPTIRLAVECTVVGAENSRAQPADASDEVILRVEAETAPSEIHSLSDHSRPMRTSTTRMIRMTPMTPTPPWPKP